MSPVSLSYLLSLCAALGAYFLVTALLFDRRALFSSHRQHVHTLRARVIALFLRNGVAPAQQRSALIAVCAMSAFGACLAWMFFGGFVAPLLFGVMSAIVPFSLYRQRVQKRRAEAAEHWPQLIEDIRLLCGSLGKPIPQALFLAGTRGPQEYRDAFARAHNEWLLSTDFALALSKLKDDLHDPTADATCEALLIAHHVGGSDITKRLTALANDRAIDVAARKDAHAKQAGVRFARRFVIIVPLGMALAGASIGNGRAAYASAEGQIGIAVALFLLLICWWWSGVLIRIPEELRVFHGSTHDKQ